METAKTTNLLSGLQLLVLVGTCAGIFIVVGQRDAEIKHLRMDFEGLSTDLETLSNITRDLAAANAAGGQRLDDLARRINLLERMNK